MAYEVSSSIAAGTNYFQAVTGSTGSRNAGGAFSPDGTKLAVQSYQHGGAGSTDYGFDIFTSSSANGWERTESIDAGSSNRVHGFFWRTDSEIIAKLSGLGIYPFHSASGGWTRGSRIGSYNPQNEVFFPNYDGTRFAAWRGSGTYLDIYTTGASSWTVNSPYPAVAINSIAWIDNHNVMVGTPTFETNKGKLWVYSADDASDTSFTETETLVGGANDYIGAGLYYQTSSGNFIVGTGVNQTYTHASNLTWKMYLYKSSSEAGYLPANHSGRVQLTSSARSIFGAYTARERNTDARAYFLTRGNPSTPVWGELVAAESGSSGWKLTSIDKKVQVGDFDNGAITMIGSNGTAVVANNRIAANNDAAFLVNYLVIESEEEESAGGGTSMALTRIGTKLIGDGAITTVKLGTSAVTRADIQSASVQVTHLDLASQARADHVDFIDGDYFIAGDATNNEARGFSFAQLKTALSLSNAARGDEGAVQYNNGTGFDGIAKIRTDGVHLTASNAGKVVFAFTGISGSTGEIYADSKTGLTIKAKTRLSLHSSGTVQGNQSGSIELRADGIFPSPKPATAVSPGTYRLVFTSGSTNSSVTGKGSGGANPQHNTYAPITNGMAQLVVVESTGSQSYIFYLDDGGSSPLPVSASINLNFSDLNPGKKRFDIPVEARSGIQDWRNVVSNLATAMNTALSTQADVATVTYNATSSVNGTASIEVTYKAGTIAGNVQVGTGFTRNSTDNGKFTSTFSSELFPASSTPAPLESRLQAGQSHDYKSSGTPDTSGGSATIVSSGSAALSRDEIWLDLGASSRKYNQVFASQLSSSNLSRDNYFHKIDNDESTATKLRAWLGEGTITGSTGELHKLDVDQGTFNSVKFSTARAAASYMITGSGTAQIHKLDADEGDFRKVSATVLTGSGTSTIHKVDVDEGTFNRAITTVVTSSGTSLLHKIDGDEGDFRKVVVTNVTSSGTSNLHVLKGNEVSGSSGKFHKIVVDNISARKITSGVSTSENFEVPQKQYIPFASGSAGADAEGAGLQIGGTAGSGSAGVASVILGDAGSGAGKDLLFKIGTTQGASLSGSISDGGQRFGVSGTLSASVGVFHDVTIAKALGAQNSIFSGSSFRAQTVTGSLATIFEIDANKANIRDVDGTSMNYPTITGSTAQAHTLDADKLTANDVDGTSLTITGIISGSTVDAHTVDVDKLEVRELDFTSLSGSGTATIHKVTTDVLSGSAVDVHSLYVDKLQINQITSNDSIKKANLNNDIVQADSNSHGGIEFANGQLSVGWKRRIFSRSSKKIVNRTQPTQGSGSLYTTCSLSEIRMVSGSEMVYFNGLLLVKSNSKQATYKTDGDYRIDYNSGGGLQTGVYKLNFTSGSTRSSVTGKGSGGANPHLSTYAPISNGHAQLIFVQSTGSSNTEQYVFYLDSGGTSPLPVSASINFEYSDFGRGKRRHDIPVEAVAGINDWRDVVTNLKNKMIAELQHSASVATISYSAAANINATASITITYDAGSIEGQVGIGTGIRRVNQGFNASVKSTATTNLTTEAFPSSNTPAPLEAGIAGTNHDHKNAGTSDESGGTLQILTSGSTPIAGTEIFLHESLGMDSDDILVVQYLSGSHQF